MPQPSSEPIHVPMNLESLLEHTPPPSYTSETESLDGRDEDDQGVNTDDDTDEEGDGYGANCRNEEETEETRLLISNAES